MKKQNTKKIAKNLDRENHTIQWCSGCGDFGILLAIKKAIIKSKIDVSSVVVVSGIGCSGKLPHYIKTFGVETLHGRALPVASGVKFGNRKLNVIVVGGDGDGYGIGVGHLIHTARRNINLTYIVHNNEIYGLTKGQTSPTTKKGVKTISTPQGAIEVPINPISLSITNGATFVAKGVSYDLEGLSDIISKGILHKGFSHIDVVQPCVSYNKNMTYYSIQEKTKRIESEKNYNPKDKFWALKKSFELDENKIFVGIFYHDDSKKTYIDCLPEDDEAPLVEQKIENINIDPMLKKYE